MEFYSVLMKKKITIPDSKITEVVRKGRRFAVGEYIHKGKVYQAWRVLGLAKKK